MKTTNLTMLLADYKNRAEYAARKEAEAERARQMADDALALLEMESRKQGMVIGV